MLQLSFEERNSDRKLLSFVNFIEKWTLLEDENWLRQDFKLLIGLKNLEYLNKRIKRTFGGIF